MSTLIGALRQWRWAKQTKLRIHEFNHRECTYQVCLKDLDRQPFAALYSSDQIRRPLLPFPDEVPAGFVPSSYPLGYIAARNHCWPDAEKRAGLIRGDGGRRAACSTLIYSRASALARLSPQQTERPVSLKRACRGLFEHSMATRVDNVAKRHVLRVLNHYA
jgi:hypothetical protein